MVRQTSLETGSGCAVIHRACFGYLTCSGTNERPQMEGRDERVFEKNEETNRLGTGVTRTKKVRAAVIDQSCLFAAPKCARHQFVRQKLGQGKKVSACCSMLMVFLSERAVWAEGHDFRGWAVARSFDRDGCTMSRCRQCRNPCATPRGDADTGGGNPLTRPAHPA
jgi:hypothetical protein